LILAMHFPAIFGAWRALDWAEYARNRAVARAAWAPQQAAELE
jgi:hypothetical protein